MTLYCPLCSKGLAQRKSFGVHLHTQHPQDANRILQETDKRRNESPYSTLLSHWASLPPWHPQRDIGLMVLQYLSDSGIPCLEPLKTDIHDSFKIEPNVLHLEQDLRANQDFGIIATGTGTGAPHLSPAHLSASFRAIDASTLMGFAPAQLCAGNNIFPTAEGLTKCGPYHAPWRQQYGHHPYQRLEASTAYCPRGHITDVHQDSLFEGRFTTVLLGRKLFLTWPPTGHNLAIYNEVHGHFTGFVLPSVLRRLQGLQVTLHSHGSVNFMPPGTIHSVLNLDSAATFAYDVLHINMAKDILRLCQWEQEVSRKLIASGDKTDTVASIADEHKDGVSRWTHFARASTDPEVHRFVKQLMSTIQH